MATKRPTLRATLSHSSHSEECLCASRVVATEMSRKERIMYWIVAALLLFVGTACQDAATGSGATDRADNGDLGGPADTRSEDDEVQYGAVTERRLDALTVSAAALRPNVAGVVVENARGIRECIALCQTITDPTDQEACEDGEVDDLAEEGSAACVIPGTVTAYNQACMTAEAVPDYEPRPGIMMNVDPVPNSCSRSECVPLCQVLRPGEGGDPLYPDWGFENNHSCVIPGTPTAMYVPSGDSTFPHGIVPERRKCMWNAPPVRFLLASGRDRLLPHRWLAHPRS